MLTDNEHLRYARHLSLKEIGIEGQIKLKQSKILIVGVGGLGSPLSIYLSAAGIGSIGLIDDDIVSESNLQRQILYNTNEIGLSKVEVAKQKLKALNPNTNITIYNERLTECNAESIISDYDIVVDGCDNLITRYLINDTCLTLNKVYVYGSIAEFKGQVSVFNYKAGKSYTDLYPYTEKIKNFTQPKGVIGVLPGIVANLQANETIKVICEYGEVLRNKLLLINAIENTFTIINI